MSRKPIRIPEFRAKLTEYLRDVRNGRELTIYHRDQPIARVVPYTVSSAHLVVRRPTHAYRTLGNITLPPPARLSVDAVDLLLEDRRSEA